ncbi:MAG: class II fumarate hydratase [Methanobacterium sp.]|nr:class II fumarate hydratase [Methanobacterium sp.]
MVEEFRWETDSIGRIKVPSNKLWGAQTQRSLEHFNIGEDLIPKEMVESYALIKKASAIVNSRENLLKKTLSDLIIQVCDEILAGKHQNEFPLHVWMTGSGTHFNMNVNEVISNRCSQLTGNPLGSKIPVHPNDHVNLSQSSNDSFPSAMHITAVKGLNNRLIPSVKLLRDSLQLKVDEWSEIVKVGRTHMQDAVPLTLGQEFSGYVGLLNDNLRRLNVNIQELYRLTLGGTAVGTGINTPPRFDKNVVEEISKLTKLPFIIVPNKFAAQGSHDALVMLSGVLKTLSTSLYKIANDIRILSSGPRCGFHEIDIPANEPGSSIMPGKTNPSQCESLSMIAVQVMSNDMAVTLGGGGGYLEMNVYKPLIIYNIMHSIRIMADGCHKFRKFLVMGMEPDKKQINYFLEHSLMSITVLNPIIGYEKSSRVIKYALDNGLTLKEAVSELKIISEDDFDRLIDRIDLKKT